MSKVDRQLMRECNIRSVIRLLRDQPGMSQTGLSEQTGLSQATVTSIIRELKTRQLVQPTGALKTPGVGRKPVGLRFAGGSQLVAACELHPDELRLALYDLAQNLVGRVDLATQGQLEPAAVVSRVAEGLADLLGRRPTDCRDLAGFGLATHGIVDGPRGVVRLAEPMGWTDVPLVDMVQRELAAPVVVEPIGRASAYGEYRLGAGRDIQDLVIVQVNAGIGMQAIGPQGLWRGGHGMAGELGHTLINGPEGQRRTLEDFASGRALLAAIDAPADPPGARSLRQDLSRLIDAADAGETEARRVIDDAGLALGVAIGNVINLLDPQVIVLTGTVIDVAHRRLLPAVRAAAESALVGRELRSVPIEVGLLGPDAALLGMSFFVDDLLFSTDLDTVRAALQRRTDAADMRHAS